MENHITKILTENTIINNTEIIVYFELSDGKLYRCKVPLENKLVISATDVIDMLRSIEQIRAGFYSNVGESGVDFLNRMIQQDNNSQ